MVGGNKLFDIMRPTTTRDAINMPVESYDDDSPTYSGIWCRKVQRVRQDRVEVQWTDYAQPLVEDFLLVVPIEQDNVAIAIQARDLVRQVDTGDDYFVLGVEDTSGMDQSYQCPIVRVANVTKVAS